MKKRSFYIYLLTNKKNSVLYTGMTNNLARRVYEHKEKLVPGFTEKYNVQKLVYYECYESSWDAIDREKQIKKWRREKKDALVETYNPEWRDLFDDLWLEEY